MIPLPPGDRTHEMASIVKSIQRDLAALISRYETEIAALRENNDQLITLIEKQDEQIYRIRHPHGNPYDIGE